MQLLSIAAHNKVGLVREGLPRVLPALYAQTVQDPTMIRIVELGPFQHKVLNSPLLKSKRQPLWVFWKEMRKIRQNSSNNLGSYLPLSRFHYKNLPSLIVGVQSRLWRYTTSLNTWGEQKAVQQPLKLHL